MKHIFKFSVILSLLIISACSTTKQVSNTVRDGSSFEKAVIVSSIPEEYAYAKKQCVGCQFLGQSLVFQKKKPYDILEYQKPDGSKISYYFDISKFYGKMF